MRHEEAFDVCVIGGGIVGLSCALAAQARGLRVAVVDPYEPTSRASYGNAGVISRGSIFSVASPLLWKNLTRYALNRDPGLRIRYASLLSQPAWLRAFLACCNEASWRAAASALDPLVAASFDAHVELAALAGAESLLRRNGWLKLYRTQAALAGSSLERAILAEHGVQVEILDGHQLKELEPDIAPRFECAMFFPQTGQVDDPGRLVEMYHRAFQERQGTIVAAMADTLVHDEDSVVVVAGSRSIVARHAVIAAGVSSTQLSTQLGCRIPLAAERGYHRHFRLDDGVALRRPVYDTAGGYVLSPMAGTVRLLSGIEVARPNDPPDHRQIDGLVEDARRTLRLGEAISTDTWMGCRPSMPDGLPVIGRAPSHPHILFAFGHGHIGLATGPVTGRIIADLLTDAPSGIDLAPFSPARFP
jgi:glycine/D-amino acid oxidase-like deaminating enzyme